MELRIRIYHSFVILSNIFKTAVKKKEKTAFKRENSRKKGRGKKKKRKKKVSLPIYVVRSASKILLFSSCIRRGLNPGRQGELKFIFSKLNKLTIILSLSSFESGYARILIKGGGRRNIGSKGTRSRCSIEHRRLSSCRDERPRHSKCILVNDILDLEIASEMSPV